MSTRKQLGRILDVVLFILGTAAFVIGGLDAFGVFAIPQVSTRVSQVILTLLGILIMSGSLERIFTLREIQDDLRRISPKSSIALNRRKDMTHFDTLIEDASRVDIVGLSLQGLISNHRESFRQRAEAGCKFRILFTHPDIIDSAPGARPNADRARDIAKSVELLKELNQKKNIIIGYTHVVPPAGIISVDQQKKNGLIRIEYHAYNEDSGSRPHYVVPKENEWYQYFVNQFDKLWKDKELA